MARLLFAVRFWRKRFTLLKAALRVKQRVWLAHQRAGLAARLAAIMAPAAPQRTILTTTARLPTVARAT